LLGVRPIVRLALFFVLVAAAGASAAQPLAFAKSTESTRLAGEDVRVDLYLPSASPPQGVAIPAHGFARSRVRHRELAQALAEAGFIAVVPDLPDVLDPWRNADAIVTLVHGRSGDADPAFPRPAANRYVDRRFRHGSRRSLPPGLAGWIGLDPVDRTRSAVKAASRLTAPAVVLLAKPSFCNLYGSGGAIARRSGLLRSTVVVGASPRFRGPTDGLPRGVRSRAAVQQHAR
jgi:hypothetical protein